MPRGLTGDPGKEPLLVILPSIKALEREGRLITDLKAIDGWCEYAAAWPGRTRFVLRRDTGPVPAYSRGYAPEDLPGEVILLDREEALPDTLIAGAAVVLAAGDAFEQLGVAAQGQRLHVPVVYVIEYTLGTRLMIERTAEKPWPARLRGMVWLMLGERRRRAAFADAAGLQANGIPAADAYREGCRDMHLFFDTRLSRTMLAQEPEIAHRVARIEDGGPLRLVFSGRLERMKGAHHLVPIARALAAQGTAFTLDIFGDGSLADRIRSMVAADPALSAVVRLHGPVDFAGTLIPWMRSEADLFLCPHLQGDPSCTYLETLGCGVPILGYDNAAWQGLLASGASGWKVPLGRPAAMAKRITELARDRAPLVEAGAAARAFGAANTFEEVFARRIAHLVHIGEA